MNTTLKTLSGEEVLVEYEASKYYPATFNDPAEGGLEEIGTVTWRGVDVSPLLNDDDYQYLWDQLERKLVDQRYQASDEDY